jgi:teichuronic acid exporter
MCIGLVVSSLLSLYINTYYTGKLFNLGFVIQMKDLFPIFINSIIMGLLSYLSISLVDDNLLKLIIGTLVGVVYYFVVSCIFKSRELQYMLSIIKR